MASVLSRIQIIMEANAANYNNELRRARQHSQSTFGKISKAAGKMALGVGAALAGMGAASVKTAMSFETAMAEVNKTADFVTEDGLGNLRKELEELSKTMPLAFEELADIAASGGQMGIAGENLAQFTETIAKMGIAFDISAGQAAESMGFIASAYQVPIEKLAEVGDAINEVSNNSGATADKTIDFMLRTGAAANNMNIAAEATAAMGAAIIDAGGSVEKSGTAVSGMLLEMANPEWLKDNADLFKKMGVSTTEFADLVKTDGLAAFNLFREGVIAADDPMSALREAFGAAAPHVQKLFDETSKFKPLLDAVGQGAAGAATHLGSLDNEYRVMADTTANAFVLIQNSARLVAANLGVALLPAVKQITDALIPMIQKFSDWAKANPELIVTIAKVSAVILSSVVAISAITTVVSKAKLAWTALSTAFAVAKVAILAISAPVAIAIAAVAALVGIGYLLYKNWDTIKTKATEIWGAIASYIGNKITEIKNYFSTNFPAMTAIVSAQIGVIKAVVIGGFNLVKNTIQTVLAVIKAVIAGDFGAIPGIIGNGLKSAAGIVSSMMGGILNIIKNTGAKLYQVGADMMQGLINGVKSKAQAAKNAVKDTASGMYQGVKDFFIVRSPSRLMREMGVHIIDGLIIGIKDKESEAYKAAVNIANSVLDGMASTRKSIALFGNDSAVAAFDYDVLMGKYENIAPELRERYRADLLKFEQMKKEEQQRAAISSAIAKRATDFQGEQKSAADAFGGLEINQPQTEAEKLRVAYENKMAIVNRFEDMHTDKAQQAHAARVKLTEDYNQSIKDLEMQKQAQTVGSVAAMFGMALGETSRGYKAMFAIQKAYDFVAAQSASFTAIAKAWSSAPFPANIPAVATTTLQTGIIPAAIQALAPKGYKQGGYTGSGGVDDVAGLVHGREFVAHAEATRRYRPELEAMNKGSFNRDSNPVVNMTVENHTDATVRQERDPDGRIRLIVGEEVKRQAFNNRSDLHRGLNANYNMRRNLA